MEIKELYYIHLYGNKFDIRKIGIDFQNEKYVRIIFNDGHQAKLTKEHINGLGYSYFTSIKLGKRMILENKIKYKQSFSQSLNKRLKDLEHEIKLYNKMLKELIKDESR